LFQVAVSTWCLYSWVIGATVWPEKWKPKKVEENVGISLISEINQRLKVQKTLVFGGLTHTALALCGRIAIGFALYWLVFGSGFWQTGGNNTEKQPFGQGKR
jgi:hypothetical protein